MWVGALILLSITAILRWIGTRKARKLRPGTLRGKVLLVTAHPDDEVMFFGPVLQQRVGSLHVLCLSDGKSQHCCGPVAPGCMNS